MGSLYKNNGIWYIAITYNGNRKCQSLKTKDIKVAKQLKPYEESAIIAELSGLTKSNENLDFAELVERFLKANHDCSDATFQLNRHILTTYLEGKALPTNPTSRAIHI